MATPLLEVFGVRTSVFTRIVLIFLEEIGANYTLVKTIPHIDTTNENFLKLNPTGKIPVLRYGKNIFPESDIICNYLSMLHKGNKLQLINLIDKANAAFLTRFVSEVMTPSLRPIFFELGIKPYFLGINPDRHMVDYTLTNKAPKIYDFIEERLKYDEWLLNNQFSLADIAIASPLLSCGFVGILPEKNKWPLLRSFINKVKNREAVKGLLNCEKSSWPKCYS